MKQLKLPLIAAFVVVAGFSGLGIYSISNTHAEQKKETQVSNVVSESDHKENVKTEKQPEDQTNQPTQSPESQPEPSPSPVPIPQPTPVQSFQPTGNKQEWLAKSGIQSPDWFAVDYIVSRESNWNPCAYNPGQSNCNLTSAEVNATQPGGAACGLGQSLPCGKWGDNWTDPVSQLQNMDAYVKSRYGGWKNALSFWKRNGHY